MPVPFPTQLSGARFLADRPRALLADQPRVGKTGAAIIAADYVFAENVLVITTASGRAVWGRGWADWSVLGRRVQVVAGPVKIDPKAAVVVVSWGSITDPKLRHQLLQRDWDLVIGDESHLAKSFDAKRTQSFYGVPFDDGKVLAVKAALVNAAPRSWCLSGTPLPNAPNDLYPMMRALCPERLAADDAKGWADVTTYGAFLKRYCVTKPKKIGNWRWIDVVIGARNLDELKARLDGFFLLRTQQDVGIRAPIYETFPLLVSPKVLREAEADVDTAKVMAAARAGDAKALEMHLGPLRRLTGEIKARAVVEAAKEEFDCGLDKIVLMAWHRETMQILKEGLSSFGVVGIDGSTSPVKRAEAETRFRSDPKIRVFIGQIQAAGEAIDLSAARELIFVEASFVPAQMKQASLRITNSQRTEQTRIRVAVLEGSIDEVLQSVLLRKWQAIREVLS